MFCSIISWRFCYTRSCCGTNWFGVFIRHDSQVSANIPSQQKSFLLFADMNRLFRRFVRCINVNVHFATKHWKDVPLAAIIVSSGGRHVFPMSNPICFRISSSATVASAPVSGVACTIVMKLSSALRRRCASILSQNVQHVTLTHCGRYIFVFTRWFVLTATCSPMTHLFCRLNIHCAVLDIHHTFYEPICHNNHICGYVL